MYGKKFAMLFKMELSIALAYFEIKVKVANGQLSGHFIQ